MRLKDTLIYNHPLHGVIYVAKNTQAFELYLAKDYDKMNELLSSEYKKCYGGKK